MSQDTFLAITGIEVESRDLADRNPLGGSSSEAGWNDPGARERMRLPLSKGRQEPSVRNGKGRPGSGVTVSGDTQVDEES
jgi:hypothetical protein